MDKIINTYRSLVLGLAILASLMLTTANASENVNLTIEYSPEKPIVFEETMFNAILDRDIDERDVFYEWDFGDGFRMEGKSITHKYTQTGKFIVSLTLKRQDEKIKEKTTRVRIYSPKPKIDYFNVAPDTIFTGQKAILNWSTSNATSVTIDPLIGNFTLKGIKQVFPKESITYTLSAINPDWTVNGQVKVSVKPKPPSPPKAVIEYSPSEPKPGQDITFDGSKSSDEDGTITSYFWDFGEGYGSNKEVVSHRYANGDIYTVTLTVTDNNSTKGTSTVSVPVLKRNHWGRYFSTISSDGRYEFFKGYYEGYLLERSKIPYVENGVRRLLDNRNVEDKYSVGLSIPLVVKGYRLTVKSIDADGGNVFLELSKDGNVLDSKVINPSKPYATEADKTYYYSPSGLVTIAVHFKEANRDYVVSDWRWEMSDMVE